MKRTVTLLMTLLAPLVSAQVAPGTPVRDFWLPPDVRLAVGGLKDGRWANLNPVCRRAEDIFTNSLESSGGGYRSGNGFCFTTSYDPATAEAALDKGMMRVPGLTRIFDWSPVRVMKDLQTTYSAHLVFDGGTISLSFWVGRHGRQTYVFIGRLES